MIDDLTLATVLISEALRRLPAKPGIVHDELKASLAEVLAENASAIRLVPSIADGAEGPQRGAGEIADATQPRVRRGAAA
jgi:hypothetical protein